MDMFLAVLVGIGLAASCGFRVFVPLLVASAATLNGYLNVSPGFDWLGTTTACTAFGVASVVEILAYYVPWLDNLLDAVASPAAIIAGTLLFAASITGLDPFLQWSLAIIAGGGSAAIVQGGTVLGRLASTATTGGLANFVVTTVETVAGFFFAAMSIALPLVTVVLLMVAVAVMYFVGRHAWKRLFRGADETGAQATPD